MAARRALQRKMYGGLVRYEAAAHKQFQKGLVESANRIEKRLRGYLAEMTIEGGKFVGDAGTVSRLAKLDQTLVSALRDSGYHANARAFLDKGGTEIGRRLQSIYKRTAKTYVPFARVDLEAFQIAVGAQYEGFANIGVQGGNALRQLIQSQVIGGGPFETLLDKLKQTLIGGGRRDKAGQGMFRHADTLANTAMMQLHRSMEKRLGERLGVERYYYFGPEDEVIREFCADLMVQSDDGKTWTADEIDELDNKQTGPGTSMMAGGGWNCRHVWLPALDDEGDPVSEEEAA